MEPSLKLLNADLQNMEIRLTEMEEKIDVINTKLTQVVDAILGNPLTKTGGFMKEIDNMKERIKQLEKIQTETVDFKKKIYWTVGAIIGVGIFIQYLVNIYAAVKK
jgi:tetrahydromethanopterin S-methyltransferase subunit G